MDLAHFANTSRMIPSIEFNHTISSILVNHLSAHTFFLLCILAAVPIHLGEVYRSFLLFMMPSNSHLFVLELFFNKKNHHIFFLIKEQLKQRIVHMLLNLLVYLIEKI